MTTPSVLPGLLWTSAFCAVLLAGLGVRFWLAHRQIQEVRRHRGAVPAAFAGRTDLAAHQKAADYTVAALRLNLLHTVFGAAVWIGWTLLGGLDNLNRLLLALMGPSPWQPLALLAAFAAISSLLALPWDWQRTFGLEQRFGFNRSSPRLWWTDTAKGWLVGAVIGLPLAALILNLMARAGPLWWLWAWLAWTGFTLLLMVVYPTWIAPWFNRFQPLADGDLKTRLLALLQRCGFRASGVFVMDGSRRSARANAYFTGLGPAQRVVLFDTLTERLSPEELEAVLAHELGHAHHRHLLSRLGLHMVSSLVGLAVLGWLSQQIWFYSGLGVSPPAWGPHSALALILFLGIAPWFGFFLSPLSSAWSRRHEFQADAFARQHASGAALASALLKLTEDNASTLTPDPWYVRFYHSHPPAVARLARLTA
jgi:STE24 endopeptidase